MMTIVHVLEPFASGVVTAVINIAQQLPAIRHIIVHGSRLWVDDIENVKKRFPPEVAFIAWTDAHREINLRHDYRALGSLIKILTPYKDTDAIIHLHSSKAGFLGRLACKILGIKKVIYTPHGASFIRTDIGFFHKYFYRLLEKLGGKFGGVIVACGRSEVELYKGMADKIICVPNGVPTTRSVEEKFRTLQNPEEEILVMFMGIASVQKNPELFNKIAEAFPNVHFYWIGGGSLRSKLVSPNITVTGWVDKDTVNGYLDRCLIYLSTSKWEGLPFGVLEAMTSGCVLLVSNVYGNRDLVIAGENGFVYNDVKEAVLLLSQMFENREKIIAMGRKSREIVEKEYSVEAMGKKYNAVYEAMGGGGGVALPYSMA
ncbi:MAG: glycosyltransferase [Treponema sp.]|jgi:glycosyltransferase involved in cell wall biosynthesis|nr:glycosyltransferase [Treponema sp.]